MTVIKRREGWPTPTAKDANGPWHTTHSLSLNVVCTQWPTPCATDYKGPGKTPRDRLDYAVNGETKSAVYQIQERGQLNPDWVEWLMAWPVGWTDIETPNIRLVWLDPSIDPADYGEIPRITNRRDNRASRVKELGNGQFPLAAAVAFHWGLCVLGIVP